MILKAATALLGVAGLVLGAPALDGHPSPPDNSSIEAPVPKGFEVVIVYANDAGACPAAPTECGAPPWDKGPAGPVGHPRPSPTAFDHDGPIETLPPSVHWSCDTRPAENVIPIPVGKGSDMYYGVTDPSQSGHFAHLTYFFKTPSVNLDHCDHTTVVEYTTAGGLVIKFLTREAYDYARNTWVAEEEVILIAYVEGCGDYDKGDRCYFKISSLDFKGWNGGGSSVTAHGKPCHPDEIIDRGETEWGWWIPKHGGQDGGPKPSSSITTSTSTPGPSFSWTGSSSGPGGASSTPASSISRPGDSSASSIPSSASDIGHSSASSAIPASSGVPSPVTSSQPGSAASSSTASSDSASPSATDDANFAAPKGGCVPPVDEKYHLPTACFGDLFDSDLDVGLGWEAMSQEYLSFITGIAPGLDFSAVPNDAASYDDFALRRRCSVCSWVKNKVIKPVVSTYKAVQNTLSISGSVNKDVSWKIPNPASSNPEDKKLKDPNVKQVTSPWGEDSILLKAFGTQEPNSNKALNSYMNIFCVGCGVSGSAKLAGRAKWTPIGVGGSNWLEGVVEVNTDIQFVFKLGIDAQMTYSKEFKSDLFNVGLPGLTYGVVTIGPRISVGTRVNLEAAAKGKMLAGAEMGLQNAQVKIDFVNPSQSSKQGWDPYFKPVFEAEGELSLSASLALPIGIKCGLQISTFDKSVGIIDEPSIKGLAQVAATIGEGEGGKLTGGFTEKDGCKGISTQLSWRNRLYIDIFGTQQIPLLDTLDKVLARGCIKLLGVPETSGNPETLETPGDPETPETPPGNEPERRAVSSLPAAASSVSTSPTSSASASSTSPTGSGTPASSKVLDITSKIKPPANSSPELAYTSQPLPNRPYNDTRGYEYSTLVDAEVSMMVVSCSNGNLYPLAVGGPDSPDCSELWATKDDVLVSDGAQRVAHYYNNTMSVLGVSRLRVEDEADIPATGVVVGFAPYSADGSYEDGSYFYLAVDPHQDVFYLVVCEYEEASLGSKIFLVSDPETGTETLKSEDVMYTVTGGKVKECSPLLLVQGTYKEENNYLGLTTAPDSAPWDLEDGWYEE